MSNAKIKNELKEGKKVSELDILVYIQQEKLQNQAYNLLVTNRNMTLEEISKKIDECDVERLKLLLKEFGKRQGKVYLDKRLEFSRD